MNNLIIFLRHVNDLDHLTPVIWKWLQADDRSVMAVFPWGCPVPDGDFRIVLLRKNQRFQMIVLDEGSTAVWSESEICNFVASLLPNQGKSCIVFDWLHHGMRREIHWAQALIPWAHGRNISVFCLPHGDHCHAGNMLRNGEIDHETADIYAPVAMFDALVVPNSHCGGRYRNSLPDKLIHCLGSPRFNSEWLGMLDIVAPEFSIPPAEDKCKIAFFLRHQDYPLFWEEIFWTIMLITQFTGIHLAVIPHTRGQGWKGLVEGFPELRDNMANLTCIEDDVYSGAVAKWADVVLDIGTSMAFEAVMRDKALICPEYLHATRTVTSKYFPEAVAWCRDEMYDMMALLQKKPSYKFQSPDESRSFIKNMIHVPDEHVLQRYVQLLQNALEQPGPLVESLPPLAEPPPSASNNPPSLIQRYSRLNQRYERQERMIEKCDIAIREHENRLFEIICLSIRKRWSNLLNKDKIDTVLLLADKTQAKQLLKILKGATGPKILGIIVSHSQSEQTIEGYPIIMPEQVSEAVFDAIILSTYMDQNIMVFAHDECVTQDKPVIDLYDGMPTKRDLERPTLEYLRHKRDMYQEWGDVDKSLEFALAILDLSPDEEDFEKFYWTGLKLHKMDDVQRAKAVYIKVAEDDRVQPELAAWALFKHGELLLEQDDGDAASDHFTRALKKNPSHAKASIFLTPKVSPLKVCLVLQGTDSGNGINVLMDPWDAELWAYYFTRRRPDVVEMKLSSKTPKQYWAILAKLLNKYLAYGGVAKISIYGNPYRQVIDSIAGSLRCAGLNVEIVDRAEFRVSAFGPAEGAKKMPSC